MAITRNGLVAGLDVGSTKVGCFIARVDGGNLRVVGIGHQVSRGMRAGMVVDMDAAESAIRAAVDAAERMAGETIREVFVSTVAGQPQSRTVGVEVTIAGHEIGENDIRRVLDLGRDHPQAPDRQVVHSIPVGYTIDGNRGIRDPRGMFGEQLGVNMHIVTAATAPLRNLVACVARGHLGVAGLVLAPFAAGLSCLVADEMDLGATLIDMGGGTTSIAIFYDGALVHVDMVPIGGRHATNDLARGLSTPAAQAERLKTLHGSALAGHADDAETLDVPRVGESEGSDPVPRSLLVGIIKPRIEETFELVRERLERSGFDRIAGRRVVLTGGASQLQGARELAARVLDKQVRLGRPIHVAGLAEALGGPAFAACAGLLSYALRDRTESDERSIDVAVQGPFARIGRWLRANI